MKRHWALTDLIPGKSALPAGIRVGRRHLDHADVRAGIGAALSVGSTSPDVVALEARKTAERCSATSGRQGTDEGAQVVILTQHRCAIIPADERPMPSVDKYDILLGQQTS